MNHDRQVKEELSVYNYRDLCLATSPRHRNNYMIEKDYLTGASFYNDDADEDRDDDSDDDRTKSSTMNKR